MDKKLITNDTEFYNFPDKITGEIASLFDGGVGELGTDKCKNCEKRRERLLEKIKINKSKISRFFRAYVEAGREFGMDIAFDNLLKIFSSRKYYPGSPWSIKELWVEDMEEEGIYDFVDEIITICSSTSDICDEKNKAGISHDLAELVYIMDKDIHGELGTEEAVLLKKNMAKWQEQIQMMREGLKSID